VNATVRRAACLHPLLRTAAVLALAGLLGGCADAGGKPGAFRTAVLDRGDVQVSISATGILRALSTVDVGTQVSGRVETVEVDYNQRVAAGQVIARIDPANLETRRAQAAADLDNARAALVEAQSALKLADVDLKRKRELSARKLVSGSELDLAVANRDQAAARVGSAQSVVKQRAAGLANAELDLEHSVIRSPVDGVVLLRSVEPGQTVAASLQTPVLFRIAEDLTRMQIDLSIDESDVGQITEGLPVRFSVDAFPDRTFSGAIFQVRLAATTVNNVVTFPVVVEVANPDGVLLPGMTANAEIEVARRDDVLRVPNAALRFKPDGVEAPATGVGGGGFADDLARAAAGLSLRADQQAKLDEVLAAMRERAQQRQAAMRAAGAAAGGAPAGGGQGGAPGGAGGGDWRARVQQMMKASLAPFRDTLDEAQRARWDAEFEQVLNARRVTLWVEEAGKPVARTVRAGVSDASHTEIVGGDLAPGATVIVGAG
jgi:HlyD family secretion protein